MVAFDWYQASLPAPLDDVLEVLHGLSRSTRLVHSRGHHGYAHQVVVEAPDGPVGRVWHGGSHEYPHVVLSGDSCPPGVELIRASFPRHMVARADARQDHADQEAFDRISPILVAVARERRVKVDTRGDHLLTLQGRTVYLGSKSSNVQLRLYDKAAELRSKFAGNPVRLQEVPDHLTRLEAQVRPATRESRQAFATIAPVEVMGSSAWLRDVWLQVEGMDLQPVQVGKQWRQSDHERQYHFMLKQYGQVLETMIQEQGAECAGLQLRDDLEAMRKAQSELKRRGLS